MIVKSQGMCANSKVTICLNKRPNAALYVKWSRTPSGKLGVGGYPEKSEALLQSQTREGERIQIENGWPCHVLSFNSLTDGTGTTLRCGTTFLFFIFIIPSVKKGFQYRIFFIKIKLCWSSCDTYRIFYY